MLFLSAQEIFQTPQALTLTTSVHNDNLKRSSLRCD